MVAMVSTLVVPVTERWGALVTTSGATIASILGALYVCIRHLISLSNRSLSFESSLPLTFALLSPFYTHDDASKYPVIFRGCGLTLMTSKSIATESCGQRSGSEKSYALTSTLSIRPLPMYELGVGGGGAPAFPPLV